MPLWVILAAATAMGLGTAIGGWRIVRTMGLKVVELRPIDGFAAETAAATVIEVASRLGIPVSTTHVISSAILGVGATRRASAVRWGVAGRIVTAWVVTIPVCIAHRLGDLSRHSTHRASDLAVTPVSRIRRIPRYHTVDGCHRSAAGRRSAAIRCTPERSRSMTADGTSHRSFADLKDDFTRIPPKDLGKRLFKKIGKDEVPTLSAAFAYQLDCSRFRR